MNAMTQTFVTAETDPNGISANTPGAKLDAGKPRLSLVLGGFPRALVEVAKVGTYGAKKYTDNGWQSVPGGFERYTDAMQRHQLAEWRGEKFDRDTLLDHAAHLAWNALARLELMLRAEEAEMEEIQRRIDKAGLPEPGLPAPEGWDDLSNT